MTDAARQRGKLRTVLATLAVISCMTALTVAAVPLYRLFCQVTGFGGTPQIVEAAPEQADDRWVTVRFDANTARGMPWTFRPLDREIEVRVGEQMLMFYEASNPTDRPVTGTATFNVTPDKAGLYFAKIDCFCFIEQTLAPGESIEMPVSFFVDPGMFDDPNTDDVHTITLSYTFFEQAGDEEQNSAALVSDETPGVASN